MHDNHDHSHDHDHDHDHAHPPKNDLISANETAEITLSWNTVKPIWEKEVRRAAAQIKLPGFRKGKVPADVAKKQLNLEPVVGRVLEAATPAEFEKVVTDKKLQLITRPEVRPIKTEEGSDWQVEVHFAQKPQVKLGKYKEVIKKAKKAADKDIADTEKERQKAAKKQDKKEKVTLTEEEKRDLTTRRIFTDLVESIRPKMPELLVREETNHRIDGFLRQLSQMKIEPKEFFERSGQSTEQFLAAKQAEALGALQVEFTLQAVTEDAKIKVEEKEIDAKLEEIKDEKLKKQAQADERYRQHLQRRLEREKTLDYLLDL